MKILFIQGGGERGYEVDTKLVASLQNELGNAYEVCYPKMHVNETLPDFGWLQQIGEEISSIKGELILVGHSLGASMLLKFLSESEIKKKIAGIFLLATPFWSGEDDWVKGLRLKVGFADKLPQNVPIFLYHSKDDEEITINHLTLFRQRLSYGTFYELENGGHQFNNNLNFVARDIKSI